MIILNNKGGDVDCNEGGNLTLASVLMAIDKGAFVPSLQILDYPGISLT